MEYKNLTDKELEDVAQAVLEEQERRAYLSQIPVTIQELAAKYAEGGGNIDDLVKAVGDSE